MDSRKKNVNNYGRVMSRVFNRSRSSLRSGPSVTRHDVPSSVCVGAKPSVSSVSISAVSSGVFTELPTVLNDFVPDGEREKVLRKRPIRRRRTLKSLDPGKTKSPQTSRDRGIEYSRSVRARGSAPTVLDSNGEEWSEAHVRQCHSSRSHTKLQELKDEIKAFRETDKLLKLRSQLYRRCGVVLDDVGRLAQDQAVQVDPVDKNNTSMSFPNNPHIKNKWIEATGRKKWFPTKNSRICSIHFHEDTFAGPSKYRRLISTAYPTIDVVMMIKGQSSSEKDSENNMPTKRKLEMDINEPSTSDEIPLHTPKTKKILNQLNNARQMIKEKDKQIKRLKEQNRHKQKKILSLVALLGCLKKNTMISDDQADTLKTTNVTTKELYSRQMKNAKGSVETTRWLSG